MLESQQGDGAIISGKVLDSSLRPCISVLNRYDANMSCVVGPNRIYYDASNGDDFKIHVPCDYLRMVKHPVLSCEQPMVEIYGVNLSNREWRNANDMDKFQRDREIDQNLMDPTSLQRSGMEAGFRAFFVLSEDLKGLGMQLEEALNPNTCLLDTR